MAEGHVGEAVSRGQGALVLSRREAEANEGVQGVHRLPPFRPGQGHAREGLSLAEESGEHQATLWRNSDGSIVGGRYPWSFGGEEAWITLDIPDVAVQAGVEYTLSISVTSDGWYPANPLHFASAGNNGQHLAYPAGRACSATPPGPGR